MKIEDVKKLSPLERFIYWIRERYQVYLRRKAGKAKPWTDDEVLQQYFFTHPYRELDKVTVWFRENVREPLRNDPRVLMATVIFRWFNLPETGDVLRKGGDGTNLLVNWDAERAVLRLDAERKLGRKIFTGAFMINSPAGEPKLEAICRRIDAVYRDREQLLNHFVDGRNWTGTGGQITLQGAHKALTGYDGLGGFMAYEIVCDLRYTYLLENAPDKLTWCNPGPGAVRGLCRLLDIPFEKGRNAHGFTPKVKIDIVEEIRKLLGTMQKRLPKMPTFEMREVEHSLCEWDKWERALWKDGRMKRLYDGR